ncbi:peptidylprolyl isomerase [Fuscibacter oryzae]|uniref:Parvulin-like PPIase n=1 Tax=Fuscibacter oryzae TaxID=2803939 RepID=A0A8J7MQL6_9RHOB|nr:peptidylprolyl isomerase [Fuscibacter oryzae]MBL4928046.1 peptidylprolyl isomerase [Fuscibacter oryzae]
MKRSDGCRGKTTDGDNGRRQAMRQAHKTTRMTVAAAARGLCVAALFAGALAVTSPSAMANQFAPVATVNGRAITQYELDQRIKFMEILRQPGDLEKMAMDTLIEDRLRLSEAKRLGIKITAEQIKSGMEEFASRANLSADEFVKAVGQGGVDPETFRDFVSAGMIWREVVRARYAGTVNITDAEVDRALESYKTETVPTLRLAEIILPGTGKERSGSLALARKLRVTIKTEADFAAAARKYSQGKSAGGGGSRDWQRLTSLDEKTRTVLQGTAPGTVSRIIETDENIAIYMVLDRADEQISAAEQQIKTEYAEYLIPNDAAALATAAAVRKEVDTCDDLYDVAKGQPADRLKRLTQSGGQIPGDIAGPLSLLDPGESSATVVRGGWRVFLMLCRRGLDTALMPSREDARRQLQNQRMGSLADLYLQELKSEAEIRTP